MIYSQDEKQANQNESKSNFSLQRFIKLVEHNNIENVSIDLESNTEFLYYMIKTTIFKGKLDIEIFDPNDKSQGKFSIETQVNSASSERANGVLTDLLKKPEAGKWLIKITPVNASGEITIDYDVRLNNE